MDQFVFQWANQRLQKVLGQDVSEVCEYLVNIEEENELLEFAKGLLGDGGEAFVADLRETRATAAAMKAVEEGKPTTTSPEAGLPHQGVKKASGGGGHGYLSGGPADRRLNKSGASNLRDLSSQRAREAADAEARLQRNLQAATSSKGSKVDLQALAHEEGMTAYMKAEHLDEFGLASVKKDPKKRGPGRETQLQHKADTSSDLGSNDANSAPVYQKPKASRSQRAQMLQANSEFAFLAPGRHHCKWVGNGNEYKLVGNCLDCGKILSDQEGEGACLVCGSEQVYLARTNAMLDGTPVDEAIMAKRRRGGGGQGDTDHVDAQLRDRDAAEDLAFLRSRSFTLVMRAMGQPFSAMDLRDSLLDFEKNRAARTTVIDDQSDYFDSSAHWLTDEQKKQAMAKEREFMDRLHRRRSDMAVTVSLDIAGRRIYGAQNETPLFPEGNAATEGEESASGNDDGCTGAKGGEVQVAGALAHDGGERVPKKVYSSHGPTVDLMGPTAQRDMNLGARHGVLKDQAIGKAALEGRAHEIYELLMANILSSDDAGRGKGASGGGGRSRVQHDTDRSCSVRVIDAPADDDGDSAGGCFAGDDDSGAGVEFSSAGAADVNEGVGAFVENHSGDLGACLSMHQPWASLAVYGVKQIEGRDWPTEHRGRLWIAATKRRPLESEVEAVLNQYEAIAEAREGLQPFYRRPESFPTSCLLGCVDVVDCVPGEVLRQQADVGEEATDCAFGFVLDNPCRLTIPCHVLGQPKIYKLDPSVVSRAQKQLRQVTPLHD